MNCLPVENLSLVVVAVVASLKLHCHTLNSLKHQFVIAEMAFSVRDPVYNLTFRPTVERGFASKIRVRSRCYDAHLVIDGGAAYKFNDGAEAILEVLLSDLNSFIC